MRNTYVEFAGPISDARGDVWRHAMLAALVSLVFVSCRPTADPAVPARDAAAPPGATASALQTRDGHNDLPNLPANVAPPKTAAELKAIRAENDATVWSNEVLAQRHEATFVHLWDNLLNQTDKVAVLKAFQFNQLKYAAPTPAETLDWNIARYRLQGTPQTMRADQWPAWLDQLEQDGYRLVETEFHHSAFEPSPHGARSQVACLLHLEQASRQQRIIVRGTLQITWQPNPDPTSGRYVPEVIDASGLEWLSRAGAPAFVVDHVDRFPTDATGEKAPTTIHPVIVQDLDNDGLPDVIIAGFNLAFRNQGGFKFQSSRLCDHPVRNVNAAAVADFDGDGVRDYLAVIKNGYPVLYHGEVNGRFPHRPTVLKFADEPFRVPINVVPGDIDGDGDLDLFLGQQKPGYFNGDIPVPYYDALDSFPAYVVRNDGAGQFTDITAEAGLSAKRLRRNFAASWIDFDTDGDLDLILTSDFSGTDVFVNDGHGKLTDISASLEPQAFAFGMSHTFGDYDLDGDIDFLTVGMSSTTARRLEQLKLGRQGFQEYNAARMKMGYGNRLYLWNGDHFCQAPFNDDVARTGWSWGSTTFDFDNDADPDIYVVNGQTSGQTTQDYCTSFWCHDIYYKPGERPERAIRELFREMTPLLDGSGISWNGYEHNALLMNVAGQGFVNVGFLMNAAFEFDSRATVSGDLDGDGRVDLIVEQRDHRTNESKVHLVRNTWDQGGHWIGVRLQQQPGGPSPFGARVVLHTSDGRRRVQHLVAGHSVWAQHDNTAHFGLGPLTAVDALQIVWPNGAVSELKQPGIDKYHEVAAELPSNRGTP